MPSNLIKYTNKGFLYEHPRIITDVVQSHSYLFPGDELVLGHKLSLPGDATATSMNDIKLIQATASIIAKKPQVFSEEFNNVFLSTRTFILDSFTVSFDKTNAKVIPWNSGTDGYAPNVSLQQNRNFQLPLNDFRRQIKFFTQHTNGTSVWDYSFLFPVLFGWEYWKALAAADDDFFNPSQPQNGQNNYWPHYFTDKWKIVSRLEVTFLLNGVKKKIRSELNLTPFPTLLHDVNDFNSNNDYISKSIKTCANGDTPSNTPALIYGNKDTEITVSFTKNSAWGADEQSKISALLWIEPTSGGGTPERTRGSSLYPVQSESVFKGLDTSLTDDSGLHITTNSGDYIITTPMGSGALVLFSGSPQAFTVFGIIDYLKLNKIYPGQQNLSLYCRIYNSEPSTGNILEVPIGQTKRGEALKQDCILVSPPDTNSLCELLQPQCPFDLTVLADAGDTDKDKNDKSEFYQYGDPLTANIVFKLQKGDGSCDGWTDVKTISDSSIGNFFAFGKANDFTGTDFKDDYNKKYTGLFIEWRKVLLADGLGIGKYRMKIEKTDIFNNVFTSYDQRIFCLKAYNCNLANGTVKIELNNVGFRGTLDDPNVQIDFQAGWQGEIRLKALFIADKKNTLTKEYIQYGDADSNVRKPYIAELQPKFILQVWPIPGWMDRYLDNYFSLSDSIKVTDYNQVNINKFKGFPVIVDNAETERETHAASERLASYNVYCTYANNNLRRRNSQ